MLNLPLRAQLIATLLLSNAFDHKSDIVKHAYCFRIFVLHFEMNRNVHVGGLLKLLKRPSSNDWCLVMT